MSNPNQPSPMPSGFGSAATKLNYAEDFFAYTVNFGNIASGASSTVNTQIQADSAFEWFKSNCYGNLNGTGEPISAQSLLPVTIQITDTGSGRQLFSAAVPIQTIAGFGGLPFVLPISRVFMPNSTIQCVATNFGAGQFDNVFLVMIGRKVWKLGG